MDLSESSQDYAHGLLSETDTEIPGCKDQCILIILYRNRRTDPRQVNTLSVTKKSVRILTLIFIKQKFDFFCSRPYFRTYQLA